MATMTAEQLIGLSVRENRCVTEYPASQSEFGSIADTLRVECDDDCEGEETSGAGRSGSEARGWVRYWGTTEAGDAWSVDIVRPAVEAV